MRKIKAIKTENGIIPDWPAGQSFPPNDPNVEGVVCNGDEYLIYETGDELPDSIKPKLHVLRDLPDDTPLWRYVDFARFYALVTRKALYFTPGCLLRDLEPYELRVPLSHAKSNREAWISSYKQQFPNDPDGIRIFERRERSEDDSLLYGHGISCWHINTNENNALWKVFVGSADGVAIKTSLGRLKQSLSCKGRHITADVVEYIDYENDEYKPHPSSFGYEQIYHKAKFFEYEREFRLAYQYEKNLKEFELDECGKEGPPEQVRQIVEYYRLQRAEFLRNGPYVPVDLSKLIEEVVIGPHTGNWFYELVSDVMASYVLPTIPVRCSMVDKWPAQI